MPAGSAPPRRRRISSYGPGLSAAASSELSELLRLAATRLKNARRCRALGLGHRAATARAYRPDRRGSVCSTQSRLGWGRGTAGVSISRSSAPVSRALWRRRRGGRGRDPARSLRAAWRPVSWRGVQNRNPPPPSGITGKITSAQYFSTMLPPAAAQPPTPPAMACDLLSSC
jgi:hypothetical protein